jgi:cell fate regulator YaaT (PSP1 superfamily)
MLTWIVRCGVMRTLHVMQYRHPLRRGDRVIVRTLRGWELGEVLAEATPRALAQMEDPPGGTIQRVATAEDEQQVLRLIKESREQFQKCREIIAQMQLPMDLIDLERLFGNDRVVVYFLSEQRVDFRELVKRLGAEFGTRIEMKQVGARDEAKLLAEYGDCGKPVCCNTHLVQMPPVSMRMAKLQKATLDPNKISGRCGRLKCCLRYEYDTYEEIAQQLPPAGSHVVTRQGRGVVKGHELLIRQVLIEYEDRRRVLVTEDEILSVVKKPTGPSLTSEAPAEGGPRGSERRGGGRGRRPGPTGDRPPQQSAEQVETPRDESTPEPTSDRGPKSPETS